MKIKDIIPLTEARNRATLIPGKGMALMSAGPGHEKENPFDSDTKHYAKKAVKAVKKAFGGKKEEKDASQPA
jgi:hypothetical protein